MVAERRNRNMHMNYVGQVARTGLPGANFGINTGITDYLVECGPIAAVFGPSTAIVSMGPGRVRAGASGPLRPSGGYSGGDYLSSGDPDFAAEVSGFGDTGTYAVLALAHAALAIPVLFFPSQTADYLFGPGGAPSLDLYKPLFRLLGVNLLSAAAKSYLLKNAAGLGTLNRRGNMRLNLSLITLGLGSAGVLLHDINFLTGKGFWTAFAAAGATVIVGTAQYALTSGHGANVTSVGQNLLEDVKSLFGPRTLPGYGFAFVTALLVGAGSFVLGKPRETLEGALGYGGPATAIIPAGAVSLGKLFGIGLLSAAPNAYTLKEASDRYKVKKDNWGNVLAKFGLYSLGNLAVFLPLLVDGKGDATLRYLTSVFGVGVAASAAGILSNDKGI